MIRKRPASTAPTAETQRVFRYLDGEMSTGERNAFEEELRAHPSLANEVQTYETLYRGLSRLPELEPAWDFKLRVLSSLALRPTRVARLKAWLFGTPRQGHANPLAAALAGATAVAMLIERN